MATLQQVRDEAGFCLLTGRTYAIGGVLVLGMALFGQIYGAGWRTCFTWSWGALSLWMAGRMYRRLREARETLAQFDRWGHRWQCICPVCQHDCVPARSLNQVPWLPRGDVDLMLCESCGRVLIFVVDTPLVTLREPTEPELVRIMRGVNGAELATRQRQVRLRPVVPYQEIPCRTPQDLLRDFPWEVECG